MAHGQTNLTGSLPGVLTVLEPERPTHGRIPEQAKPWFAIGVAQRLRNDVRGPLREMSNEQLKHMAATIALNATILPHLTKYHLADGHPNAAGHASIADAAWPWLEPKLADLRRRRR